MPTCIVLVEVIVEVKLLQIEVRVSVVEV
jgi:hypothetical protein